MKPITKMLFAIIILTLISSCAACVTSMRVDKRTYMPVVIRNLTDNYIQVHITNTENFKRYGVVLSPETNMRIGKFCSVGVYHIKAVRVNTNIVLLDKTWKITKEAINDPMVNTLVISIRERIEV